MNLAVGKGDENREVIDSFEFIPLVTGASDTIRDFVIPEGFDSANITFIVTNLSGLISRELTLSEQKANARG